MSTSSYTNGQHQYNQQQQCLIPEPTASQDMFTNNEDRGLLLQGSGGENRKSGQQHATAQRQTTIGDGKPEVPYYKGTSHLADDVCIGDETPTNPFSVSIASPLESSSSSTYVTKLRSASSSRKRSTSKSNRLAAPALEQRSSLSGSGDRNGSANSTNSQQNFSLEQSSDLNDYLTWTRPKTTSSASSESGDLRDQTEPVPEHTDSNPQPSPSSSRVSGEERLLVVANRLPMTVVPPIDHGGEYTFVMSSGGLVSGLAGVKGMNFVWIGWPGTEVPFGDRAYVTQECQKCSCNPVYLDRGTIDLFYNGFCNNVLWPLIHYIPLPMEVGCSDTHGDQWDAYYSANDSFVEAILEVYDDNDIVWVHDYHLMLVPKLLRSRKPNARIGWFLHTPFPSHEVFRMLPYRTELLTGLLSANLVGFHVYDYLRHFISSCVQLLGLESTAQGIDGTPVGGVFVNCGAIPIGIEARQFTAKLKDSGVVEAIRKLKAQFGRRKVILGVDRLDYMKGLPHKLNAFDRFLELHPEWNERCVLVQLAVPSRTLVPEYQRLKSTVHELVGMINGRRGNLTHVPVHYLDQSLSFDELVALYRVADVAFITSLRDGMNLVAYEFIACQAGKHGVLILSEFTGAAQSLGAGSIRINPWNLDETAEAIYRALSMSKAERRSRHDYAFNHVKVHTSQKWADIFIECLRDASEKNEEVQACVPPPLIWDSFLEKFLAAKRRLLIIDLLDALTPARGNRGMPMKRFKKLIHLPQDVLESLNALSQDENTLVIVTTPHPSTTLERIFSNTKVCLAAEKGCVYRNKKGEWVRFCEEKLGGATNVPSISATTFSNDIQQRSTSLTQQGSGLLSSISSKNFTGAGSSNVTPGLKLPSTDFNTPVYSSSTAMGVPGVTSIVNDWSAGVEKVLDFFQRRTPGSYTESTTGTLTWYWDDTLLDFGKQQSRDLLVHLWAGPLSNASNADVEVVVGSRFIEVRSPLCSRGKLMQHILEHELGSTDPVNALDFVACIGNFPRRDDDVHQLFDQPSSLTRYATQASDYSGTPGQSVHELEDGAKLSSSLIQNWSKTFQQPECSNDIDVTPSRGSRSVVLEDSAATSTGPLSNKQSPVLASSAASLHRDASSATSDLNTTTPLWPAYYSVSVGAGHVSKAKYCLLSAYHVQSLVRRLAVYIGPSAVPSSPIVEASTVGSQVKEIQDQVWNQRGILPSAAAMRVVNTSSLKMRPTTAVVRSAVRAPNKPSSRDGILGLHPVDNSLIDGAVRGTFKRPSIFSSKLSNHLEASSTALANVDNSKVTFEDTTEKDNNLDIAPLDKSVFLDPDESRRNVIDRSSIRSESAAPNSQPSESGMPFRTRDPAVSLPASSPSSALNSPSAQLVGAAAFHSDILDDLIVYAPSFVSQPSFHPFGVRPPGESPSARRRRQTYDFVDTARAADVSRFLPLGQATGEIPLLPEVPVSTTASSSYANPYEPLAGSMLYVGRSGDSGVRSGAVSPGKFFQQGSPGHLKGNTPKASKMDDLSNSTGVTAGDFEPTSRDELNNRRIPPSQHRTSTSDHSRRNVSTITVRKSVQASGIDATRNTADVTGTLLSVGGLSSTVDYGRRRTVHRPVGETGALSSSATAAGLVKLRETVSSGPYEVFGGSQDSRSITGSQNIALSSSQKQEQHQKLWRDQRSQLPQNSTIGHPQIFSFAGSVAGVWPQPKQQPLVFNSYPSNYYHPSDIVTTSAAPSNVVSTPPYWFQGNTHGTATPSRKNRLLCSLQQQQSKQQQQQAAAPITPQRSSSGNRAASRGGGVARSSSEKSFQNRRGDISMTATTAITTPLLGGPPAEGIRHLLRPSQVRFSSPHFASQEVQQPLSSQYAPPLYVAPDAQYSAQDLQFSTDGQHPSQYIPDNMQSSNYSAVAQDLQLQYGQHDIQPSQYSNPQDFQQQYVQTEVPSSPYSTAQDLQPPPQFLPDMQPSQYSTVQDLPQFSSQSHGQRGGVSPEHNYVAPDQSQNHAAAGQHVVHDVGQQQQLQQQYAWDANPQSSSACQKLGMNSTVDSSYNNEVSGPALSLSTSRAASHTSLMQGGPHHYVPVTATFKGPFESPLLSIGHAPLDPQRDTNMQMPPTALLPTATFNMMSTQQQQQQPPSSFSQSPAGSSTQPN